MAIKQHELEQAIEAIVKKHGNATPQIIVNEARNASNPLHNEFDWNDESAANQHRLAVARSLLRRIEYIGYDVVGRPVTAVGYVHEPGVKEQSYVPLSEVVRNKAQSKELIMQELAMCESHIRRAQRIADALHLRGMFDELLCNLVCAQDQITKGKKPKKKPPRGRNAPDLHA